MDEGLIVSEQPVSISESPVGPSSVQLGFAPKIPRGLEYLATVDQLLIKQEISIMEMITDCEARNKYRIFNSVEQEAYFVEEESDACHRLCCGVARGFVFHITDNNQREVIRLEREFKCCGGPTCCQDGCSMYPIYIKDADGQTLGMVRARSYFCTPHFGIYDAYDVLLYEIRGECCPIQGPCCPNDIDFPIFQVIDGSQVGNISKQWGGFLREAFTRAETFGLQFPLNLEVRDKALMIGAVILIDFMIFERLKKRRR